MNSEAVLSVLFDFVGKGHFLYVAGVSRSWRWHYTPKAKAEGSDLVTSWHDAVATVSTLEYGFANGLEFSSELLPKKEEFGLGVYEWARQHGLPLFVWVAQKSVAKRERSVRDPIFGVFSSACKADEVIRRVVRQNSMPERVNRDVSCRSSFTLVIKYNPWTCVHVVAFAVEGLEYADEVDPLHLCVTTRSCWEGLSVQGVFPTKELANESIKKVANEHKATLSSRQGLMSCTAHDYTYAIKWEGCLDVAEEEASSEDESGGFNVYDRQPWEQDTFHGPDY